MAEQAAAAENRKKAFLLKGRLGEALAALGFLAAGAALLVLPGEVQKAVGGSILYCLTVLIPSLFPFMVLTGFGADSPAGDALGRWLGFLPRYLFRLPAACAAPILLSFLGGYPAGAKGVSLLLERGKITEKEAGRMMLFCVNPGAAFVVTFLGGAVLGDFRAGWVLFASVTLSGMLLGFFTGLGKPVPKKEAPSQEEAVHGGLMGPVSGACRSVVIMCACIVLFAGFLAILRALGLFEAAAAGLARLSPFSRKECAALLSFLFEVTGGVGDAARFQAGPCFYAFGLAFGGLCVHLQVFACFAKFPGNRKAFFLFRAFHGALSAGVTALLLRVLPGEPVEALAAAGNVQGVSPLSGTLAGGLSLLLMCLAFLLIAGKEAEGLSSSRRDTCPCSPKIPPAGSNSTHRRKSHRHSGGKPGG